MTPYPKTTEQQMQRFYRSLNERDQRRYAGIESEKLGHGGQEYISTLFECDPRTIRHGMSELESGNELPHNRQRKKGVDAIS